MRFGICGQRLIARVKVYRIQFDGGKALLCQWDAVQIFDICFCSGRMVFEALISGAFVPLIYARHFQNSCVKVICRIKIVHKQNRAEFILEECTLHTVFCVGANVLLIGNDKGRVTGRIPHLEGTRVEILVFDGVKEIHTANLLKCGI